MLWAWQRGTGAGSGSVPRRSSWAQHVPAFTPRIPAGCWANSGTGTFALAAAQHRGWERSFRGGERGVPVLLPRGPSLGEPRGSSWGPPHCPGPLTLQTAPTPVAAARPWELSLARDPIQESTLALGQCGFRCCFSGPAPMGTPAPLDMAQHSTGHPPRALESFCQGSTCCAHSLSRHSTAPGHGLLWPGEDAPAPRETLAQPRQAALMPGIVPQPSSVPFSHAYHRFAASPPAACRPAGHRGTDLCRCRGCSSSFWKQTKQKESIAQLQQPPCPSEGDWRPGSAKVVLASSSPLPVRPAAGGSHLPTQGHGVREPFTRPG